MRVLQIDASAHCQLACPSCPTASGATRPALSAGHLEPDHFRRLLDLNPDLREVELSNYGEMFLNPKLCDLLRIAQERGVTLNAANGTNLNHAPEETLEALVTYGFGRLTVSIDGASPATYAQYRKKGNFDRVISNIRKLNDFKARHRSAFPQLTWQFIVFGHNEHEIQAARQMAASLGMQFRPKISWDDDFSPIRDAKLVQIQTGQQATREAQRQATGRDYMRGICHQLWHAPVVNWDGRLLGCCRNFWGHFGDRNAFKESLESVISGSDLPAARMALMGRGPMPEQAPCTTCDIFRGMQQGGDWITPDEVETNGEPGVLAGIVIEQRLLPATHVDIFVGAGHEVNRLWLARPPRAQRVDLRSSFSALCVLPSGRYTVYLLPKQIDPAFRKQFPALPPVTLPIAVAERPAVQQFRVEL